MESAVTKLFILANSLRWGTRSKTLVFSILIPIARLPSLAAFFTKFGKSHLSAARFFASKKYAGKSETQKIHSQFLFIHCFRNAWYKSNKVYELQLERTHPDLLVNRTMTTVFYCRWRTKASREIHFFNPVDSLIKASGRGEGLTWNKNAIISRGQKEINEKASKGLGPMKVETGKPSCVILVVQFSVNATK